MKCTLGDLAIREKKGVGSTPSEEGSAGKDEESQKQLGGSTKFTCDGSAQGSSGW